MTRLLTIICFLCAGQYAALQAQISPGPLTNAHAELEGMMKCTQCHVLGKKVSNDKCLACHKEIDVRIDRNTGYHAAPAVKGKECASCHSEHHGRNFDMINFDEDKFDHRLSGYDLTGKHKVTDCRECHKPDLVADAGLKKRKDTFLGLEKECVSCHLDVHQNTLSNKCASCHTTEAFSPAVNFDHSRTEFPLLGKHNELDCVDCHRKEIRKGQDFQNFAGLAFANCNSCHQDVHLARLGSDCRKCHVEQSFNSNTGLKSFDHRQTGFPLKGSHGRIDCAKCHNMKAALPELFQDKAGFEAHNCAACHEDVHENKFGSACADCHNEESFFVGSIENFNHGLTDFELEGKHRQVDCRKCHVQSFTAPLEHNACAACHSDFHEGQLMTAGTVRDCRECHTVDGFNISLFTPEDHNEGKFRLEGSHAATPCFACHLKEGDQWKFRQIGQRCADCHEDVHREFISEVYYPDGACENCHSPSQWPEVHFDHLLTGFELQGRHAKIDCRACHTADEGRPAYEGYAEQDAACTSCHENVHGRQFEEGGVPDCTRCHGFENWFMSNFNHDNTAFKLEGRHAEIDCDACHLIRGPDGVESRQYKFERFECIDCHL